MSENLVLPADKKINVKIISWSVFSKKSKLTSVLTFSINPDSLK